MALFSIQLTHKRFDKSMAILCCCFIMTTAAQDKSSEKVRQIDSLINTAIKAKAFPGAQLLIYKNDSIRLHRSYGYHTYDSLTAVKNHHLYDLASVTKVLAGTLAFMKLYELYKIDLDRPVSDYIPTLKHSNKSKSSFKAVLSHSAGWLPYISHQNTVYKKNGRFRPRTLATQRSKQFPDYINASLFVHKRYSKKMMKRIRKTEVSGIGNYRYSGLWFFLIPQLVEDLSGNPFHEFLDTNFYNPLGAERLGFVAAQRFPLSEIVPTEQDTLFRKTLVHGWVHDEAAALMGGISGNAGLFGSAESLSKPLEMLLKEGTVNGIHYLKPETIRTFTSRAYPNSKNRRGMGFDKPEIGSETPYPSAKVSPESYGHSGFTGTFIWVDPTQDCFMIFLSNRVYPSREQRGIYDLNVRSILLDYAIDL